MDELGGAEPVDVDVRELRLDPPHQVEVPRQRESRMMPALEQDLRPAQGHCFFDLPIHLLGGDDVGVRVALAAAEGAELAVHVADVGIIDVAVDEVGDDLVAAPVIGIRLCQLTSAVRQQSQFRQGQAVEGHRFGAVHPPAIPDFLQQLVERGVVVDHIAKNDSIRAAGQASRGRKFLDA